MKKHRLLALAFATCAVLGSACAADEVGLASTLDPDVASERQPAATTAAAAPVPGEEPVPSAVSASEPAAVPDSVVAPGTDADLALRPPTSASAVIDMLDSLIIATERRDGYERELFRHWVDEDGDGCDTRREVLIDEAVVGPTIGERCALSDGQWVSRYDGQPAEADGRSFDVDHLVPLAEAWDSGAHAWPSERREQYANDLGYENSLIAVSAASNRSKGAQDPTTWLPTETGQHCWYAAAWVHVKTRWALAVDQDESSALRRILTDCSVASLDVGMPAPLVTPAPAEQPAEPQEATEVEPSVVDCHSAYYPCLPDLPGDALNCGDLAADQMPVAVLVPGVDPYRLDRDGDGRGCAK